MPAACTALLLTFCVAASCLGSDAPGAGMEKTPSAASEKPAQSNGYVLTRSKPADSTATAVNSEVYQNVVIAAGKNVIIQSSLDYSSSNTVAVAILCRTCTTVTTSLGALGLVLEARWQTLDASYDVATENKAASALAYWDAGGALFNVYAELFNLELQNTGSTSITIDQVTIFSHAQ